MIGFVLLHREILNWEWYQSSVVTRLYIHLKCNRIKIFNTNRIVQKFENCETPNDKKTLFNQMSLGVNLYDDLTSERVASNFGHVDIMKEVIEERYMKNKLTYATSNYKENHQDDIEAALLSLGERYGSRVYDRLFEMFNIVAFTGKSMRR